MSKWTAMVGALALAVATAAPLTAKADVVIGTFTTGVQLDSGGCATASISRGIGTGFRSANVQISSWDMSYTSSDHHIRRAKAEITSVAYNAGTGNVSFTVNTCFHDQNSDDDYQWEVKYTVVAQP